ncbi:TolC family protein [Pseudoduganella sp. HUAS MS19]
MHVFRLPRAVAGLAMILPVLASAQLAAPAMPQASLQAMVESAWQRSPQARTLLARQDEASAEQELAASWLAAAPVVELSQRSDRWSGQRGSRESEVALSTTIWTPGQKARRAAYARAYAAELDAQVRQARLELAGQVRSRLWQALAAQEQAAEKLLLQQHLQQLAQDVQRRVEAGDLPRSDALLAQQELVQAQSGLIAARGNARAALARLTVLTGQATLPPAVAEALPPSAEPAPVRMHAAQAAEQRARAAIAAAAAQPSAAPTIALAMRRERDGAQGPNARSIGLALQIPLAGRQRNRPLEAAAATQLATASAELAQTKAQLDAERAEAQNGVQDAQAGLQLAEQRAAAAQEHARLLDRAFALGERSLPELLRSRIQEHEALLALSQQRIALGQAIAGLNQALGIIP